MKQIIPIILGIVLISLASAVTIYSGECSSIEFSNIDPVNWSVEGNSSDMEGFSFNKTGTNITYCFHLLYKPDNFTLTFYNYQYIEESIPSNGGSSRGRGICFRGYVISNWSECKEGIVCNTNNLSDCVGDGHWTQTREVKKDWKKCYLKRQEKPIDIQSCEIIVDDGDADDEIPDEKESNIFWRIILVILLLLIIITIKFVVYVIKKKKQKLIK